MKTLIVITVAALATLALFALPGVSQFILWTHEVSDLTLGTALTFKPQNLTTK